MSETVIVTPTIQVPDSALDLNSKTKLAFKIGKYEVKAYFNTEDDLTEYSVYVGSHFNLEEVLRAPSVSDAQEFLYKTILQGIFEDGTLEVVNP